MCIGLFGATNTGSEVKNLTLADVSVSGGIIGAGGVVGYAEGNISGCAVSGSVTSSAGGGTGGVAGMVGDINACTFTGTVTGGNSVGGVVGGAGGAVSNCYSTGSVSGTDKVGGVAGSASGAVSNCYSTGAVSGDSFAGGIVGKPRDGASVSNCAALNPSVTVPSSAYYGSQRVCYRGSIRVTFSDNIAFEDMTGASGGTSHDATDGADITDLATLKATYEKDGNNTTSTVFDDTTVWNTFDGTTLPTLVGVGPQTLARPAHLHASGVSPFAGTGNRCRPLPNFHRRRAAPPWHAGKWRRYHL